MGKLNPSVMRSAGDRVEYDFSGEDGSETRLNMNQLRSMAKTMAANASLKIELLSGNLRLEYDKLVKMISVYRNYGNPYQGIYDVIVDAFSSVTSIIPGTVGETFMGCVRASDTCGTPECNLSCYNAALKPPGGQKLCAYNILKLDAQGNLTVVSSTKSASAHIYLETANTKLSDVNISKIEAMGINQVRLFTLSPTGICTPITKGPDFVKINQVNVYNRSYSGWWWLWWILAIIVIIIIIIVIVVIIAAATRGSKDDKPPPAK
jgi:hypothetical protein